MVDSPKILRTIVTDYTTVFLKLRSLYKVCYVSGFGGPLKDLLKTSITLDLFIQSFTVTMTCKSVQNGCESVGGFLTY